LELIITVTFAFITIKLFKSVAIVLGLVDKPGERKKNARHILLIVGAIFAGVLAASLFWLTNTPELRIYLVAAAMMVFIGALDDKFVLKVRIRIVGQIVIASLMIYGIGVYILHLGDLFSFGDFELGPIVIILTYFATILVINAFNMVDVIDGLIGNLSLNTFTAIAILFLISGNKGYLSYPLILATATLTYLIFNLGFFKNYSKKIFMGDAGIMFIGLSVIWLLTIGTQGESASFRPVTALWICAIPLMVMLAIVMRRYREGKSPFKQVRDHLRHMLQRACLTSRQTLVVISISSVIMSLSVVLGEYFQVPESIELALFVLMLILYNKSARHFS
jgi:UDP-GlcNAc:undecaprenyl-phosphate GlcNAc-1-phosphate transferase